MAGFLEPLTTFFANLLGFVMENRPATPNLLCFRQIQFNIGQLSLQLGPSKCEARQIGSWTFKLNLTGWARSDRSSPSVELGSSFRVRGRVCKSEGGGNLEDGVCPWGCVDSWHFRRDDTDTDTDGHNRVECSSG